MNEEYFFGGWYSQGVTRFAGFKGVSRIGHGYGIYVTDKRIVGAEEEPKGVLAKLPAILPLHWLKECLKVTSAHDSGFTASKMRPNKLMDFLKSFNTYTWYR